MAGVWVWAVQIMLPIPLLFVLLLALPAPRRLKGGIISVCRRVLDLPTFGHLRLFHFATLVAAWMFAAQCWGSYQVHQQARDKTEGLSPCEKTQVNADKWRHDRNFWISGMILLLWIVLRCFYEQSDRYVRLIEQLEEAGVEPDYKKTDILGGISSAAQGAKESAAGTVLDAKDSAVNAVSSAMPQSLKGTADKKKE